MDKKIEQRRVKTPTILQMEATECGSVSLAILLAYYGKFITAEEARCACGVSRDGTKAINIIKAARNFSMSAQGANASIDELMEVNVPFIVYWQFNHFLIVEGYNTKWVFINDPATGPRRITWEEFENSYTGIILELRPNEGFQKGGTPEHSILTSLIKGLGSNSLAVLFILILTLALAIPETTLPLFVKSFVDYYIIDKQQSLVPLILGAIAISTIAQILLSWILDFYLLRLKMKLEIVNTVTFVWYLLHIPMNFFQQRSKGDIIQRNMISEHVSVFLANDLPKCFVELIKVISFGFIIALLSPALSIIILLLAIVNILIITLSRRMMSDLSRRYAQEQGKLEGVEANGLYIMETLKVGGFEDYFFNRWIAYYTHFLNTLQQITWLESLIRLAMDFPSLLAQMAVIGYGALLVMKGQLTIGTILAIQLLMASFISSLSYIISFISHLFKIKGDLVRLNDVMNTPIDRLFNNPNLNLNHLPPADNCVELKNITFSYSPLDPPIIYNLSLEIKQGARIAIAGSSGSGKSTIARLICGLNTVEAGQGAIFINGYHLELVSRQDLSEYIAYVDQTALFFLGTIRENLTLWDENIDDDAIYNALKIVDLYDEIMMRGGLEITLEEQASNFSTGQSQRLEIARALIRRPKLLILDEATSAIEPSLEAEIYKAILTLDCTLIIIAHRLNAIKQCDRIYMLQEGEITQVGTHEDLINVEGLYKDLLAQEII